MYSATVLQRIPLTKTLLEAEHIVQLFLPAEFSPFGFSSVATIMRKAEQEIPSEGTRQHPHPARAEPIARSQHLCPASPAPHGQVFGCPFPPPT